jgi:hypothetical protein
MAALEYGTVFGAIITIMLYTRVLYKDNVLYGISEHLFLGSAAGYLFVIGLKAINTNAVIPIISEGKYLLLIPLFIGLLLYVQVTPNRDLHRYSRIPTAILIGVGLGVTLRRVLVAYLVQYTFTIFKPFIGVETFTTINNLLVTIGVITALSYFIMSRAQTGTWGIVTKVGRYFLMAAFGAYFGTQVMGRLTILAGRIEYILLAFGIIS